ncbi:hypothetical protein J2S17_002880 [Cytobacillus purgationiresistens]|uniref:Uncharacterized protein n=1 Tax=Cytobacillus purgationiresistens TaxID=863449 RepID=A0ABU0AJE5_9BACI|nr:hypothetical protein [Cytobacillus purgationiresistens]
MFFSPHVLFTEILFAVILPSKLDFQ